MLHAEFHHLRIIAHRPYILLNPISKQIPAPHPLDISSSLHICAHAARSIGSVIKTLNVQDDAGNVDMWSFRPEALPYALIGGVYYSPHKMVICLCFILFALPTMPFFIIH